MAYYVGDIPAHDLVIEPAFLLDDFETVTAELTSPDPEVDPIELDAVIVDDTVEVSWPVPPSILTVRGLYGLRITLGTIAGAIQRLPLVGIVVQDDSDGWHSLDSIREVWNDAPENDRWLYELLEVAKADVVAYAPALAVDQVAPDNYRRAQFMHARDIWTASHVDPDGAVGEGNFSLQPFPLDWMVKQVLRPKTAVPVVP